MLLLLDKLLAFILYFTYKNETENYKRLSIKNYPTNEQKCIDLNGFAI